MSRMSPGKQRRMRRLSSSDGIIAALAIDQRGTLWRALAEAGKLSEDVLPERMAEFKACVTRILGPHATAVLLDVDYGMRAIAARDPRVGLLLAYEKWGYDTGAPGRLQQTLEGWDVPRLMEAGADCIKLLLYYTPFESEPINARKQEWIRRIGQECLANDIPFCLEPVTYDPAGTGENTLAFARTKPWAVEGCAREFSKPEYGVDLLKIEIPVNLAFVAGTRANGGRPAVCSRSEALEAYRRTASATRLPFVYLSAGVSNEVFLESLELAAEAGVPYNGVLCGRATWKDAIPVYAQHGVTALEDWLSDVGVRNIQALNNLVARSASPWWDRLDDADAAGAATA